MSKEADRKELLPEYKSYMLRLWRIDEGEEGVQVSLESIHTGKRKGFANLEAMLDFLHRQMAIGSEISSEKGQGDE